MAKKKSTSKAKKKSTRGAATSRGTKKSVTKKKAPAKKAVSKKKAPAKKATTKKVTTKGKGKSGEATTSRRRRRQIVVEAVLASETDARGFVLINGRRIRRISAETTKKTKRRSSTATADAKTKKNENEKPVKTNLAKADLTHFRLLLISKRRELFKAVDSMETEALRSDDGDTSSMPIHMADIGSDVYEQDLMLGMAASERERIRDIDEALQRVVDGTYGICDLTKKPISKKRLNAKPWAKYSIDAARKIERGL